MKNIIRILIAGGISYVLWGCTPNNNNNVTPVAGISGYFISSKGYVPIQVGGAGDSAWGEYAVAFFSSVPGDTNLVAVDSVYLNGYPTEQDSLHYLNIVPGGTGQMLQMNASASWQVWGANGVPSFSYSFTSPYPVLPLDTQLPDTIDHNVGITIVLPTGSDSTHITILDAGNGTSDKHLSGAPGTTVSFSANDLAALTTAGEGLIHIETGKYSTQTFSNKTYLFAKTAEKLKLIWVK